VTTDRNCLDAETVAAWMDGGLDAAGVAAAEAHASTCERCQVLLATVAKTLPAGREQSAVVSGFSRIDKHQSLWKWWLAPIAATAAAVTIWMVVPQTPMQRPASQVAREVPEPAAKAQPQSPPAEFAEQAPAAATPPPPARDTSRRNVPAAANEAQAKLADSAANARKLDTEAVGRKDASAAARDQSAERGRDAQGKREEGKAVAEMRQAAEPPSVRGQSGELLRNRPAAAPPAAPSLGAVSQLRKESAPVQIVSPDPNSRWRATPSGIERSEDGGRIWIPVRLAGKEEVLAGASPGRLVAWLVGRSGLVLLTTDGANFTRLPFPEPVDLVTVSSPEPRIATVTTADGRTFRTEDAGRSWSLQDFEAVPF
jgi:hypothetical protein